MLAQRLQGRIYEVLSAYVSGHGYGHATRVGEVLRALRGLAPDLPLTVVTSAPEVLFRRAIPGPFAFRSVASDIGLVQQDALVIDEDGTLAAWRVFDTGRQALVEQEADWLRGSGARLVLADLPPLAFEAAARAGIAAIGLANFSWDWIYRHLGRRRPEFLEPARWAAASYGLAREVLRLPFAGDLGAFPRVVDLPLVARRPRVSKTEARRRLGLAESELIALWSFGGLGLPAFDRRVLAEVEGFRFVEVGRPEPAPDNVTLLPPARLDAAGLEYPDVVGAADVVVTKPGYGIVSDAIGAGARLLFTERGDFPEYPVMVAEMDRYLPCRYVSNEALRAGRIEEALRALLEDPFPPAPPLDGAAKAARHLLAAHGGAIRGTL